MLSFAVDFHKKIYYTIWINVSITHEYAKVNIKYGIMDEFYGHIWSLNKIFRKAFAIFGR